MTMASIQDWLSVEITPDDLNVSMEHVPTKSGGFEDQPRYQITRLFSEAEDNGKLALSDLNEQFMTIGLSLAPALQNGLFSATGHRIDLCPGRSGVCTDICLNGTGHARVARNVNRARV